MDKNDLTLRLNQIGKKLLIKSLPNYFDNKIASAQCKSSVMLAALLAPGQPQ